MRIGIDFDNTIVNYDGVFHAAALERGLIPADFPTGKNDVRDYLNGSGRKDDFTELQGYVYGTRMDLASVYPGFEDFVRRARGAGHDLFVVSHKTRLAMLGPKHDLHEAARGFLRTRQIVDDGGIPFDNIYFALTKDEKAARAHALGVEVFIDDLPEVLGLLKDVRRVLFAPDGGAAGDYEIARSWAEVSSLLLGGRQ